MENTVEWAFLGSFEEIVEAADIFIVGEVIAVAPAPDRGRLPGTNSTIRVTQIVKGRSETGDTITVYQTGGVYRRTHAIKDQQGNPAPLPPEAPPGAKPQPPASIAPLYLLELEDDPLFRVGESVALGLTWVSQRTAYLLVSGPQARFRVDERGEVHPMLDDHPAVSSLDGISLEELTARVAAIESSGATPPAANRPGRASP